MIDKKYNKVLTVILIIIVIAIVGVLGFWGYDVYQKYYINKSSNEALDEFDNRIQTLKSNTTNTSEENVTLNVNTTLDDSSSNGSSSNSKISTQTYKGFTVAGKIEIPKINISYPVLERATEASMKVSVAIAYGAGLNQVGNTVIMGHNYRNGTFFSNNKKLENGDLIYITDTTGNRIKYTIYNVYTTGSDDFDYATRDTAGKREISLSTCTDDVKSRLVIWAKED